MRKNCRGNCANAQIIRKLDSPHRSIRSPPQKSPPIFHLDPFVRGPYDFCTLMTRLLFGSSRMSLRSHVIFVVLLVLQSTLLSTQGKTPQKQNVAYFVDE